MTEDEFKKKREQLRQESKSLFSDTEKHSQEEERLVEILSNADFTLKQLDALFEQRTALQKKDFAILFLAVALQLTRIYLLPHFEEKFADEDRYNHDDDVVKKMERDAVNEFKDKQNGKRKPWKTVESKGEKKYRTWQEIAYTIAVPYDATKGSKIFLGEGGMHGGLHRVKTLGHDPVLGWIFGTANILTDTISICPEYKLGEKSVRLPVIESFTVEMKGLKWKEQTTTASVFAGAFDSCKEDIHRLYAAIFSQGLHLESDKYTKNGLPIPYLTLIDSDKAYEIYQQGYDYLDYEFDTQILRRTAKSAIASMIINAAIAAIHRLFYNPQKDGDSKLYSVKTRRVVLYSNIIATSSDIIKAAIQVYIGKANAIKDFDLGGFLITLRRLVTDVAFIQKIKEEFIFKEWNRVLVEDNNF